MLTQGDEASVPRCTYGCLCSLFTFFIIIIILFFMTQKTKANGFIYTQHSLLCFLSIVQVPRITSLFPRMTFRPLFSTMQTASLLSSHPIEAAMCGVAGAMYYLCERAFASRWKPAKVCLFFAGFGNHLHQHVPS